MAVRDHDISLVTLLAIGFLFTAVDSSLYDDVFSKLNSRGTRASELTQQLTVVGFIERVVGNRSVEFTVIITPDIGPSNRDTFILSSDPKGHLTIRGTTGVAAAWGFYYFISQYAGGHISWAGYQANLPSPLPKVHGRVKVTSNDRFRYYMNVCTMSYSFVWYDWSAWERQLDWMAMNAINLPLAFVGQEEIWRRVYIKMGFTQEELDTHFAGPAFLAWQRMGNMHGWGGPLPRTWYMQQVDLQRRILFRMRDFGMIPVLPAFAGHVPANITRLFPHAKVTKGGDWGGFNKTYCCTTLLDFTDPLFQEIGSNFIKEYTREYGSDHVYNCDTFNENQPPSSDPEYIKLAGQEVYRAMNTADPDAIWLMQGWLFGHNRDFWTVETSHALLASVAKSSLPSQDGRIRLMQGWLFLNGFWTKNLSKALVTSVPRGRLMILDMPSAVSPQYPRLESYFGQPFIWTMVHNYGGNVAMYGAIEAVNKGPFLGRDFANSSMVGTGLTMEGINQNDVMYEFMMENTWRKEPRNISAWISDYHKRRYGHYDPDVDTAWQLLKRSVYNNTGPSQNHGYTVFILRPSLTLAQREKVWYQPEDVFTAWDHMVLAAHNFNNSKLFRYDLVDVTRQSLQLLAIKYYTDIIAGYKAKDEDQIGMAAGYFLNLLRDMESVLASDTHFLLGRWLEAAKARGTTQEEKKLYEYNARNQITLWGPTGEILDYANKQWSGMIADYYYPRWQMFISELMLSVKSGKAFDRAKFNKDVFESVEQPFTFSRKIHPTEAYGDSIIIAKYIHTKYRQATQKYAAYFAKLPQWSVQRRKFIKMSLRWQRKQNRIIPSHEEE